MAIPGLYIGSTAPYAGKNTLSIGLGLRFERDGHNPGYMKPVGTMPFERDGKIADEDSCFVQDVLNRNEPTELVTPLVITQDFRVRAFSSQVDTGVLLEGIKKAYAELSARYDLMLVAGAGSMFSGRYCRLDGISLVRELGLKALIIDRLDQELNYDILVSLKDSLGDSLAGVIINDIPSNFMDEVEGLIKPFLERNKVPVLGIIPSDPLMGSVRASDLAECLGGRMVASQNRSERMVESFLIGSMQVENFMAYFRRTSSSAVIVGGDRADVQLVAIEGDCACLILTGNLYPNDIILSRADSLNVPIIMVREDTYSVAKKMDQLLNRHKLRDIRKIRQAAQLVSSNTDFHALSQALGLN